MWDGKEGENGRRKGEVLVHSAGFSRERIVWLLLLGPRGLWTSDRRIARRILRGVC